MEDDQFIREVNEELREDRLKTFWDQYKVFIIGAAVAIVVSTAGYRGWEYYTKQQAADSGDKFMAAIQLSNEGKYDDAIKSLEALGETGSGQYPALAKLRIASDLAKAGKSEEAVAAYDAIAGDSAYVGAFQSVAKLRAGLILVDSGSYEDVAQRLAGLSKAGGSFRHSAREALGLSAWRSGKLKEAYGWFKSISDDAQSTGGTRSRADVMLQLLAGKGITSAE